MAPLNQFYLIHPDAAAANQSFKHFLFGNKTNRITLIIAGSIIVLLFSIFKYLYPFVSYIHGDSFSYIEAALQNREISIYLIGYSQFLRLFSVFSKIDLVLAIFQYLSIQGAGLFLLFTCFYFYNIGKWFRYILLAFLLFNPLLLHLGNLVSSDCLFTALSMTWFALLLWIIHKPSWRILIWHAVAIYLCFTFRYNSLIYPVISAIAFLLSRISWRIRLAGFGLALLLIGSFYTYTSYYYKKLTGAWQYSPFSGWQLANNAMYIYRYVDSAQRKPVPAKFRELDNMIRAYFDSTRDVKRNPLEAIQASTFYMWSSGLPLYKYRDKIFKQTDSLAPEHKRWASIAPFYKEYGVYIIKQYPSYFLEYFVWPNSLRYYAPPVEFLGAYNSDKDVVAIEAAVWFRYSSNKVHTRMKSKTVWILDFYPILSGINNLVILCLIVFYLSFKGWKSNPVFNKGILMGITVWFLNAAFTISASSAALRFQSFPLLLTTFYLLILLDWFVQLAKESASKEPVVTSSPIMLE